MTDIPAWLSVMRAITGLTEEPGSGDNPKIMHMADVVAREYPEMKDYAALYTGDDVAWCGLTMAYVMTMADIRPVFGDTDTERWMWALAWSEWPAGILLSQPRLGCVVVTEREGGGHVTLWEGYKNDDPNSGYYRCRGGNQSDQINVTDIAISSVVALVWPVHGGPVPPPERRSVELGDTGPDVVQIQISLMIPADGDFGPVTHEAVQAFQKATGLAADGVVGPDTWEHLDELDVRMAAGGDGIPPELAYQIDDLVSDDEDVQAIFWQDRGEPFPGYYAGMAKVYALAVMRWLAEHESARIMSEPLGDPDKDALAWYADEFSKRHMSNKESLDRLRNLFVMMIGLGMRESSGNPWEGRDMNASNVESDTCEAGLFQTSWNIRSAASAIEDALIEYRADPNGFQPTFVRGMPADIPSTSNLDIYGSGDGATYQWLAKQSPAFACIVTGMGMRRARAHWGPIGRREVEIKPEIEGMLIGVEDLIENFKRPTLPPPGTVMHDSPQLSRHPLKREA